MNLEKFRAISKERDLLMYSTIGNILGILHKYTYGCSNAEETLAEMQEFINANYTARYASFNEQLELAAKEEE